MTHFTPRRTAVAGLCAAGLLAFAAACGTSGSGSSSGSTTSPASAAGTSVHTTMNGRLGTIVVNGKGFTLYRFDMDTAKPSASHCAGSCAAVWPAAPAAAANAVQGVNHKLIGSVTGTNGAKQLTIAGWPVYTFSGDGKAGDTNGQGFGGTWWAVTPSGGKAAATSGSTMPTAPSGGGNGY